MKKLEKLAQLTDAQLCYGALKYLGYPIYVCGDHEASSPHQWPGNHALTQMASEGAIVTLSLQGEIHVETAGESYPVTMQGIVAAHLNDLVNRDAVRQVSVDADGQYSVSVMMGMDPDLTCHVHGNDLYKALCYGFVLYHCGDSLDVPDVLVTE